MRRAARGTAASGARGGGQAVGPAALLLPGWTGKRRGAALPAGGGRAAGDVGRGGPAGA